MSLPPRHTKGFVDDPHGAPSACRPTCGSHVQGCRRPAVQHMRLAQRGTHRGVWYPQRVGQTEHACAVVIACLPSRRLSEGSRGAWGRRSRLLLGRWGTGQRLTCPSPRAEKGTRGTAKSEAFDDVSQAWCQGSRHQHLSPWCARSLPALVGWVHGLPEGRRGLPEGRRG